MLEIISDIFSLKEYIFPKSQLKSCKIPPSFVISAVIVTCSPKFTVVGVTIRLVTEILGGEATD